MAGPYPTFPSTPSIGDTFTDTNGTEWVFTSIGWVKKVVELNQDYPIYVPDDGGGITDGDLGDITVSGDGTVWTIDNDSVTYAKIQNVTATDKILGRSSAGSGDVEEITCTAAGRALLDDADATAQRSTLGLVINTDVQAYDADTAKLDVVQTFTAVQTLPSPELTGSPYVNGSYRGNIVAVAALNIDCSLGNYFTKTINGASTFTVSNVPASRAYSFSLELTHTSGSITWFSGVIWPGGTAPTLTTGKVHLFMFVTDDGGTTWRASSLVDYAS
jgi:hypothetical protein